MEQFSPVVDGYRKWARGQGRLEAVRIEAFWGKHRIADPRPTIGVLSEIVHSVDLIRYLFPAGDLRILGGHGVESDFSPHSTSILDSVDVHASVGDAPVLLHSSYAWPGRQRSVSALLWSPKQGMVRVELEFDTPHWDCDRLDISTISDTGRWTRVYHASTDRAELPPAIQGVGKVVRFLAASLGAWRDGPAGDELVDLATAAELQRISAEIDQSVRRLDAPARYRRSGTGPDDRQDDPQNDQVEVEV